MSGIVCCRGCENRKMSCHSMCKEYKRERAALDKKNSIIQIARSKYCDLLAVDTKVSLRKHLKGA